MIRIPRGFYFTPTPGELVGFYLGRKVNGIPLPYEVIREFDPFIYEPWELFEENSRRYSYVFSKMKVRDMHWNHKPVGVGTWLFLGCEEIINHNGQIIGYDRQYIFLLTPSGVIYHGDWVMHQFSLPDHDYGGDRDVNFFPYFILHVTILFHVLYKIIFSGNLQGPNEVHID
ncbi:hypothetical protein L6164_037529 [Bauhinia variegata]|uniref:Uncharacterized protein n=1 Tax=Bauhinia variegata TaxID=167791 RepID=A0ACB9KKH9_BAUVA|nr:hypothetical protein L6164_037529 [Bauhinia variegata]